MKELRTCWNIYFPWKPLGLNLSLLKSIDIGISKSEDAYNSRNLLTSEIQTLPGLYPATVPYGYDADGLRPGLQGGTGGSPVSYTYKARAQLQSVIADPAPLATYTDDKAGRNTALLHENGITESKTNAAASQLLANTHLNGRNSKGKFKRTYKRTHSDGKSIIEVFPPIRIPNPQLELQIIHHQHMKTIIKLFVVFSMVLLGLISCKKPTSQFDAPKDAPPKRMDVKKIRIGMNTSDLIAEFGNPDLIIPGKDSEGWNYTNTEVIASENIQKMSVLVIVKDGKVQRSEGIMGSVNN